MGEVGRDSAIGRHLHRADPRGAAMRAIAARKLHESPEPMDLPKPAPGPGEILVQVGAAGVNPFDWKILDGLYDGKRPHVFPLIAGVDAAGVVEAVGPGVQRFAVGDGVYGTFLHDPVGIGTYAEYVTAPESIGIAKMPRGMYSAQGAAVPTAGMTAVQTLDELGLTRGQTLLINGAAGGIGSYATQLASNAGIQALTTSKGPHRDYLHKLGAQRFFDANSLRLNEEIRMAYPDGVDALLDLYNRGPALDTMIELVKPNGQVASTIGAVDLAAVTAGGRRGRNIDMHPRPELLDRIGAEFATGRLRIPMELKAPLAEGPKLLAESRAGTLKGKAVLTL